ncbi:MAG TPA: hypothetical protein PKW59_12500 [Thermotogota bacterium]|nr:hypothetical protein [Thermotogota bacterium]
MEVRVDKNGKQYGVCDILAEEGSDWGKVYFHIPAGVGKSIRMSVAFKLSEMKKAIVRIMDEAPGGGK